MSHTLKAKLEAYDVNTLEAAFETLGWKVTMEANCRGVYRAKPFAYVAINPSQERYGVFDMAFEANPNDKVDELTYDGDIRLENTALGTGFSLLKQSYQVEVAKRLAASRRGRVVSKVSGSAGAVIMKLEINV